MSLTFTNSTKWALRKLVGSNLVSDIDAGFSALADDIDSKLTPHTSGLLSARPTSTVGTPGKEGRTYRATDTSELFLDYGTGWTKIPQGAIDLAALGLNEPGTPRRGKSIIATAETRTSTSYGTLTTPDKVTVALPTDGLIFVTYTATWQASVGNAATAAIFLGSTQTQIGAGAGGTIARAASMGSVAAKDTQIYTMASGLVSSEQSSPGGFTNVTTGQILGANVSPASSSSDTYGGGPAAIFATAGTYDVSIQFRSGSGSVTVKDRRLWVWTMGF